MEEILLKLAGAALPVILQYISSSPTAAAATTTAIGDVVGALKKTTAATTVNSVSKPSEFVRSGQHLINQYLKPSPPLVEDGWLGKKTEKAIADAVAPYGIKIQVDA